MTLECKMIDLVDEGMDYRLLGKVVNVVADENVLTGGKVDLGKMQAICYDSALRVYRLVGEVVGHGFQDGLTIRNK